MVAQRSGDCENGEEKGREDGWREPRRTERTRIYAIQRFRLSSAEVQRCCAANWSPTGSASAAACTGAAVAEEDKVKLVGDYP